MIEFHLLTNYSHKHLVTVSITYKECFTVHSTERTGYFTRYLYFLNVSQSMFLKYQVSETVHSWPEKNDITEKYLFFSFPSLKRKHLVW